MNIQSLSICVPGTGCINQCKFCVSRMRGNKYKSKFVAYGNHEKGSDFFENFKKRMEFARDNNCNTVMLTGECEPQQNIIFLDFVKNVMKDMERPFRNVEIQTTGARVNNDMLRDFKRIGICTISLSISSFDNDVNNEVIGTSDINHIDLKELCYLIKDRIYNFNLRLSLNITDQLLNTKTPDIEEIFERCKNLGADQITFREMYVSDNNTAQDKWIAEHMISDQNTWFKKLSEYIKKKGNYIDTLEYGQERYSVDEMSVVVDDDCMAKKKNVKAAKYLILRPDCHLYTKWDDKGSLVF